MSAGARLRHTRDPQLVLRLIVFACRGGMEMSGLRMTGLGRLLPVWLVTIAVAGCAAATVTPSGSVPAATGSMPAATASSSIESGLGPTGSPSPQPTDQMLPALRVLPVTTVPADQIHAGLGDPASIARGSLVYTVGVATGGKVTVTVTDMTTGHVSSGDVAIPADEVISTDYWSRDPVATDGRYLVVLASHPFTGKGTGAITICVPHGNDWQLLTARLDPSTGLPSGGFTVFASGTMKRDFHAPRAGEGGDCWDDNTVFALDG